LVIEAPNSFLTTNPRRPVSSLEPYSAGPDCKIYSA